MREQQDVLLHTSFTKRPSIRRKQMPGTPLQRMKASAKKIDSAVAAPRISEEERLRRKKEKEEKEAGGVAPWVVGLLLFVVLGSSVVQIFFSIQSSPSMSDEH